MAWAGLVLLGDGDLVPFPEGLRGGASLYMPLLIAAGMILLILALRRRPLRTRRP